MGSGHIGGGMTGGRMEDIKRWKCIGERVREGNFSNTIGFFSALSQSRGCKVVAHRLNLVGRWVIYLPGILQNFISSQDKRSGDFTQNPEFWPSLKKQKQHGAQIPTQR